MLLAQPLVMKGELSTLPTVPDRSSKCVTRSGDPIKTRTCTSSAVKARRPSALCPPLFGTLARAPSAPKAMSTDYVSPFARCSQSRASLFGASGAAPRSGSWRGKHVAVDHVDATRVIGHTSVINPPPLHYTCSVLDMQKAMKLFGSTIQSAHRSTRSCRH